MNKYGKHLLLAGVIFATSLSAFAQRGNEVVDRLVNKTWYVLAMKCPDEVKLGGGENNDKYMQYYFSIELSPTTPSNQNYGSYTRISNDMDTNPRQTGKYAIRTDESGLLLLTLTNSKNQDADFSIKVPDENHLTLFRMSESTDDKCTVHYAIAP